MAYSDGLHQLITTDADGKNPKYDPIQLLNGVYEMKAAYFLFESQFISLFQFSIYFSSYSRWLWQILQYGHEIVITIIGIATWSFAAFLVDVDIVE